MANPGNAVGDFQMSGARISLEATSTGSGTVDKVELRDATLSLWPTPKKGLHGWNLTSGSAMRLKQNYTVGRPNVGFTLETPFTADALSVLGVSLLQDETYVATEYTLGLYTLPIAAVPLYMHIESGIAGQSVFSAVGCMVRSLSFVVPPSGEDGGRPMLRAEIIGCNSTRGTAFTLVAAVDADAPKISSDFHLNFDAAAQKMTQCEITLTNSAGLSPNIGAVADAVFVGGMEISGSISVIVTTAADDEYDFMQDEHELATLNETVVNLGVTGLFDLTVDALFDEATHSPQPPLVISQHPLQACYVDAASLSLDVTRADLAWTP